MLCFFVLIHSNPCILVTSSSYLKLAVASRSKWKVSTHEKLLFLSNTLSELCCTCGDNCVMSTGHFTRNRNLQFWQFFLCCWNKSEWLHRPGQASVSVAFRAAGITKCLFSLRSEEEGLIANCLDVALSIKPESLGLPHHVHLSGQNDWLRSRESKGDFRVSLGSHQVDLGHSCVRLETPQGGRAVKKHMYPSFIKPNCCFSKLVNELLALWFFINKVVVGWSQIFSSGNSEWFLSGPGVWQDGAGRWAVWD